MSTQTEHSDFEDLEHGDDPTKVLVRRYLAYLVDFLLILLIGILALAFTAESNTPEELGLQSEQVKRYQEIDGSYVVYFRDVPVLDDQVGILIIEDTDVQKVFLAVAAAWVLLYVGLQGFTGATVGKGAAGIRSVKKDGEPPGVLRALVRSIFLPIDSLPSAPFLPLVGTIFAVATTGNRRLGDLVGGTYVIDKDATGRPVHPTGGGTPVHPVDEPDPLTAPEPQPEPVAAAPLAATAPATWDQSPAPAEPASGDAPPWAARPDAAPGDDLDWTSEQPAPGGATTDPWAPAAGAGTAASDWEAAIASEQAQPDPQPDTSAADPAGGPSIDDYEPQWDDARKSYIQWDPRRDEWLQYSDELQQWHPIDRPPST